MSWLNVILRATLCLTFVFLPLHTLDEWFYDKAFQLRGTLRQPPNITLVRVSDEKILQVLRGGGIAHTKGAPASWLSPHSIWYRSFYEPLLANILADKPRAIIFTSFFGQTNPEGIIPAAHQRVEANIPVLFASTVDQENKLVTPAEGLAEGMSLGFNNIFMDQDNIVRRSHLVYSSEISLGVRLFRAIKGNEIPADLTKPIWIDFRGPSGSYPSVDGWSIFEQKTPNAYFKDKVVLIGHEGSPASDLGTPLGSMSRLEIHANTIDTLLAHHNIRMMPRWSLLAASVVAVGLSLFLILYFPLKLAWVLLLVFAGFMGILQLFLFAQFKLWFGLANPLFSILGTHLVMVGYKLGRQDEEKWRFEQEAAYLRQVDEFKNNFISLFSHDLKTPISKIKAISDRLLGDTATPLPQEAIEGLRNIEKTNSELARFINDILKVTKMESMKLEPRQEVVDINRVVEGSLQRMQFLAQEKEIELIADLEPLFSIEGDAQLLQEVVTNLIENAIKYSPSQKQIVIQTREVEKAVRVSVIDQGAGIPGDELMKVTSKFFRGRSATQNTKGSGLGLYLSKYFVELHGGTINISSEVGKGTTVSFDIPT